VLDEVKTGSSRRSQRQQSERDDFQQAKALQVQARLLIGLILDQKDKVTAKTRRRGELPRVPEVPKS
jgi:hypothetical protein